MEGGRHTVKLLVSLEDAWSIGRVTRLLRIGGLACDCVSSDYDFDRMMVLQGLRDLRRTMELAKVRLASTRGAARRAAAMAERWRNIVVPIGVERRGGGWFEAGKVCELTFKRSCHPSLGLARMSKSREKPHAQPQVANGRGGSGHSRLPDCLPRRACCDSQRHVQKAAVAC